MTSNPFAAPFVEVDLGTLDDATEVLKFLAGFGHFPGDTQQGRYAFDGHELDTAMTLGPGRLSDAVSILEENGYVEVLRFLGTAPYKFGNVELTARGRFEAERLVAASGSSASPAAAPVPAPPAGTVPAVPAVGRSPSPVGSPYGFREEDWESVMRDREDGSRLIVVFGHQWSSTHFNSGDLRANVQKMFTDALAAALLKVPGASARLDYRPLKGGYGDHLFNEIARDIIGSDIAVFDTSDQNSNVMVEMGVALTWGTRVLPIRTEGTDKPPSDISGQTWATYTDSGASWVDKEHLEKLVSMVERVLKRKTTR